MASQEDSEFEYYLGYTRGEGGSVGTICICLMWGPVFDLFSTTKQTLGRQSFVNF